MDWQKGQSNDLMSIVLIFIVHINQYVPLALHCYGECRRAISHICWSGQVENFLHGVAKCTTAQSTNESAQCNGKSLCKAGNSGFQINWFLGILASKVLTIFLSTLATLNWHKYLTATSICSHFFCCRVWGKKGLHWFACQKIVCIKL